MTKKGRIYKKEKTVCSISGAGGLPWWLSGWESACQFRGHRFDPWSRNIPHATEQLSPCAAATEAHAPRAYALQREVTAMRSLSTAMESSLHSPQLQKARVQQRRSSTHTHTQLINIFQKEKIIFKISGARKPGQLHGKEKN